MRVEHGLDVLGNASSELRLLRELFPQHPGIDVDINEGPVRLPDAGGMCIARAAPYGKGIITYGAAFLSNPDKEEISRLIAVRGRFPGDESKATDGVERASGLATASVVRLHQDEPILSIVEGDPNQLAFILGGLRTIYATDDPTKNVYAAGRLRTVLQSNSLSGNPLLENALHELLRLPKRQIKGGVINPRELYGS